jgi:dipeptide/tripeptide permease
VALRQELANWWCTTITLKEKKSLFLLKIQTYKWTTYLVIFCHKKTMILLDIILLTKCSFEGKKGLTYIILILKLIFFFWSFISLLANFLSIWNNNLVNGQIFHPLILDCNCWQNKCSYCV